MSYETFWYNVRRAAAGVFRTDVYFADEPQPTPDEIDQLLRADTRWFRASTVAAFRTGEGLLRSFLSREEPDRLSNSVAALEDAVRANDLDEGVAAFADLLGVLNFYRYNDPDGFRYGKQVEQRLRERGWPDYLRELRFWRATQHDDFRVLSIYAHLKESVVKTIARYLEACGELRPVLNEIAAGAAPDWFAHITFRTDETLEEYTNRPDEDDEPVPVAKTPAAGGV